MGLLLCALLAIICVISLYAYLRVLYECVRKVRIVTVAISGKNVSSRNNRTLSMLSASEKVTDDGIKDNFQTAEFRQAPGPLPWPILGNLALIGRYAVPFEGFTELSKKFGDVYSLTLGTTRCLIVNNLDLIREVLNQNGKYFGGRPDFLRFHVLFGGDRNNSLALCDWSQLQQKRRNLARKHCSPRDATSFFQKMSDVGCFEMQEFMERLQLNVVAGEKFALKPLVQQTCANMFSQYMCSVRFNYDDKEFQHIVRCFDEIFWEINQGYAVDFLPWLSPFYSNHMKRIVYWSETIRRFILERIINDRECNINIDEPERDFTDALLKSLAEDEEVTRDTIIFMLEDFIGGHSAIGNLVMLALAYIVRNPETGRKIQKEVDSVIGTDTKRKITLVDTEEMPYTVATIYEVLRCCSSPIVPHVATEDVAIAGYGVTKGTIVFINNYKLNTSSEHWNEPDKFNPERFLESLVIPKIDANSGFVQSLQLRKNIPYFLPFSIGKRTCIGQNLVKGFGFIMLSNIMNKYDISCNDITEIKTYPACVAVPPDTFSLTLTPRIKSDGGF